MHYLIQEKGWKIVRQEAIKDLGRHSQLRDTEEVCGVLKNNSVSKRLLNIYCT